MTTTPDDRTPDRKPTARHPTHPTPSQYPQPTQTTVRGSMKHQVGQIAPQIRKWRPPDPYKGKGVRYAGEHVIRNVGKRA